MWCEQQHSTSVALDFLAAVAVFLVVWKCVFKTGFTNDFLAFCSGNKNSGRGVVEWAMKTMQKKVQFFQIMMSVIAHSCSLKQVWKIILLYLMILYIQ